MKKIVVSRKFSRLFLLLIGVVSLLFLLYYEYKRLDNISSEKDYQHLISKEGKESLVRDRLEIIADSRDDNGRYPLYFECDLDLNECTDIYSNHEGANAVWARYQLYKKYGDINDLAVLKNDLANYTDIKKFPILQTSFWNCRLLYEIINDKSIENSIRDDAKELCLKGVENPSLMSDYQETKDYNLNNLVDLVSLGEINIGNYLEKNKPISSYNSELESYSVYSSEYVIKTRLAESDQEKRNNLNLAYYFLDKAVSLYESEGENKKYFTEGNKCLLAHSALDIYDLTNEYKYFVLGTSFYNGTVLKKDGDLRDKVICKMLYDRYYKHYGYEGLYNDGKEITASILKDHFDYKGSSSFINSRGLFYSRFDNKVFYDIRFNNIFLGLYTNEN